MNRNASILVTVLSILAVLPSLFFTIKKWNDENLKQRADNYIKRIREINPEIAILNYKVFENKNKKYLDITILNDRTFIPKDELLQHDQLLKDINLIWHYSKTARNNTDIEYLQNQINALRLHLENQKNQNIRIEKGKKIIYSFP